MSLGMIKQNVRSMIETIDNYNSLLKKKENTKEEAAKIAHLKSYFLKLITNVQKLTKEEEKQL